MNKLKKLWVEDRILFVLFIIVAICLCLILGVCVSYFFGSSKSSYGDRLEGIEKVEVTDEVKNKVLDALKQDETIIDSSIHTQGKIVYVSLEFAPTVTLVEAESKALTALMNFEQKYQDFYDFHFTLKNDGAENNEGFLIMGSKNVNGTGLIWNNNTPVEKDSE